MRSSLRRVPGFTRLGAAAVLAVGLLASMGLQDAGSEESQLLKGLEGGNSPNEFYVPKSAMSPYQVDQADPSKPPKVYTVPLKGQLGTDILGSVYEDVIEDIRKKKPDLVIFILDSADFGHHAYQGSDQDEQGMFDSYDMRPLVFTLKGKLKDIPQVMWVHDSVGMSSLLAFGWPDIFMKTNARLYGMYGMMARTRHFDYEVRRKFYAAATGIAKGFLEAGGYDAHSLGGAMIDPALKLSVSWEGRKLIWQGDENGTYVVDPSDKTPAAFDAKSAEDLLLSKGTVDELDDLLFLLGYREWDRSLVEKKEDGAKFTEDYVKRWRKSLEQCIENIDTYERELGWANGDDAVAHLGKAKKAMEEILAAMTKYEAVEKRLRKYDLSIVQVKLNIQTLKEQIAAANKKKPGGGGGSAPGGGRGRGLGGGQR